MKSNSSSLEQRYAAQMILPEIGIDGQQRLQAAKVLCVGLGGLASAALPYLAAAGVGAIGLMDGDQVALVNLHRQLLYRDKDIGGPKVAVATAYLSEMQPNLKIEQYPFYATPENAATIVDAYDYVLDASDNFATHLLLNDVCWIKNKALVLGAVETYYGYCMTVIPWQRSPCLRCFLGQYVPEDQPSCSTVGVLGTLPGLIGVCQATQLLKLILNLGADPSGTVLWCDALNFNFKTYGLNPDAMCVLCGNNVRKTIELTNLPRPTFKKCNAMTTQENLTIDYDTLSKLSEADTTLCLIDVRSIEEHRAHNIGGTCIPLNELLLQLQHLAGEPEHILNQFSSDHLIVVYCQKGLRSQTAATALRASGFTNVFSLKGGMESLGTPVS